MSYDWHTHPLRSELAADGKTYFITRTSDDGRGQDILGRTHIDRVTARYRFLPDPDRSYSDTELWQLMCFVCELNSDIGKPIFAPKNDVTKS